MFIIQQYLYIIKTYTSSVKYITLCDIWRFDQIQFNYPVMLSLITTSTLLVVIILIKVIYHHNPHGNEHYGHEIVLFHSDERYKKRVWRFNLIEEIKNLKNQGNTNELSLNMVVGELSEDTLEIIKHAANHNFGLITIIAGNKVFCEDKTEIYSLLDKYKNVKYFVLARRPTKHFMIFNEGHLYIEKPHRHNETRGSVGIKRSHPDLLKTYNNAFNKMLKYATPLNKDEVFKQQCYRN